jgi:transcription initiation factor TFIIB
MKIHDGGLATVIGNTRGSRPMNSDDWQRINSLRKWQARVRIGDASERTLAVGLSEVSKLSTALSLPRTAQDTASLIYRRAIKKRLIRGRSILTVTAAAIYMSCRKCGIPRTLDEIAGVSMLSRKELGRSFRFLFHSLGEFVPPSTPRTYAAKFANRLNLSGKAEGMAIRILEKAHEMKLTSGRGPAGIAAASTYIATVLTNERKTQREIAEIANVTEVTIRNRYRELLERLELQVPL